VPDPALSRRRALTGAAVGGLSLPLLAACGGGPSGTPAAQPAGPSAGSGGGQSNGGPSGGSTSGGSSNAILLTAASGVPVGGGVILGLQNVVVTQPTKGRFEGFSATCTHQGCILATVSSGTINCACHGSQFSITDGSNVTGPLGSPAGSVAPLPKVAVKLQGKDIVAG
jgi:nitrite reductase/ring-hydroxylating ferredoxin subunit